MIQDISIAIAIVLLLAASLECGFRRGRRSAASAAPGGRAHLGAIQGTFDFDHPRAGLIQLNDVPLAELHLQSPR